MDRIILTGATSMLGLALIDECIKHNTKVIAVVRENSTKLDILPKSDLIEICECDIGNLKSLGFKKLCGAEYSDAFFHFAWANTDRINRFNPELQNENIQTTLDAVKLAGKLKCKKFIGAGSQAEYGRYNKPVAERFPVSPDEPYGVAKYAAGRLAGFLCESMDMDFIWTRIFSVYGLHDMESTMIMYCIKKLLNKEKPSLTKCEQEWDYLFSEDAGRAFHLIGEKGKNKAVYNIGGGIAKPLSEYVRIIRDSIDTGLELGIGEREYSPNQLMYLCSDITKLKNDTGFVPEISFKDGIAKIINNLII